MKLSRREFLIKSTALLATLGLSGPLGWIGESKRGFASDAVPKEQEQSDGGPTTLVVVQLSGGNDGINTLIPYGFGGYYDARPTLRITEDQVLAIDGKVGLHPSLTGLYGLYEQGVLAIIQGVGYPNPNRSHFRSMEIWHTAEPENYIQSGWLARYIESSLAKDDNPLRAVQIGLSANKSFNSEKIGVPLIKSIESYNLVDPMMSRMEQNRIVKAFLDMYDPERRGTHVTVACERGMQAYESVEAIHALTDAYQNKVEYPNTNFAKDLQLAVKLLAGGSRSRVLYVDLGGFDDHAAEKEQHAKLLKQMDEGLTAFYRDLEVQGLQDRVAVMVFSEFGRRVKENGSGGTDHGKAAPVLVFGGKVKGGLYGVYPSLTELDQGDLKYQIDFRSVYYTLVEDWLKGDAKSVLGKSYEKLGFV